MRVGVVGEVAVLEWVLRCEGVEGSGVELAVGERGVQEIGLGLVWGLWMGVVRLLE